MIVVVNSEFFLACNGNSLKFPKRKNSFEKNNLTQENKLAKSFQFTAGAQNICGSFCFYVRAECF